MSFLLVVCSRPTFAVEGKPEEELYARRRRSLPDQRCPQRLGATKKHRTINGCRCVLLAGLGLQEKVAGTPGIR